MNRDILEKLGINLAAAIAYLIAGVIAFSRLCSSHDALASEFHEYKSSTVTRIEQIVDLLVEIQIEQSKQGTKIDYIEENIK